MTAEEIKARLKELGIKQAQLSRQWKKPPGTVSLIVNRKLQSRALETKLARRLGVSLEKLREPPPPQTVDMVVNVQQTAGIGGVE